MNVKTFINEFLLSEKAAKYCGEDGQWFRHPDTNRTWSNYTLCNENTKAKLKVIYLRLILSRCNVMTQHYLFCMESSGIWSIRQLGENVETANTVCSLTKLPINIVRHRIINRHCFPETHYLHILSSPDKSWKATRKPSAHAAI